MKARAGLRAVDVHGCLSSMRPTAWALSPAVGLALAQDAGLWANVRAHRSACDKPFSRLVRELTWAPCHEAPLRRTRNESLPAAHLDAELLAHLAGLGLYTQLDDDGVHAALRAVGVSALAKRTRVTIARFVRLARTMREAADQTTPATAPDLAPLARPVHALVATLSWDVCSSRECLLRYLLTLQRYAPVLADERLATDADERARWLAQTLPPAELACAEALGAGARAVLRVRAWEQQRGPEHAESAAAFELLAAASASSGMSDGPPEVKMGHFRYRGQTARADCVEVVLRQTIDELLWCAMRRGFELRRLPVGAAPAVRAFYEELDGVATGGQVRAEEGAALSQRWFELCAQLRRATFLSGSAEKGGQYELAPTLDNVVRSLAEMLGVPLGSIAELEAFPAHAGVEMPPVRVRLDRTMTDREGFHLTVGERRLGVCLKQISNHAFVTRPAPLWAQPSGAAALSVRHPVRAYAAAWSEGRVQLGPASVLLSRLVPPTALLDPAARGASASRGAAQFALLSARLLDAQPIAAAMEAEASWARPAARSAAPAGAGAPADRLGISCMLVRAFARHATLRGPQRAHTWRCGCAAATVLELSAAHATGRGAEPLPAALAASAQLSALVGVLVADVELLQRGCAGLDVGELARIAWLALVAPGAHARAPGTTAHGRSAALAAMSSAGRHRAHRLELLAHVLGPLQAGVFRLCQAGVHRAAAFVKHAVAVLTAAEVPLPVAGSSDSDHDAAAHNHAAATCQHCSTAVATTVSRPTIASSTTPQMPARTRPRS